MKIIITGSEGFIGTALIKRLRLLPVEVVGCIDSKLGIEVENMRASQFTHVDVIIHLAAQTSVFNKNHDLIIRDNIVAFKNIVDVANQLNAKLIYASSSCANNITSLYGITKKFNEEYADIYSNNATGIRFHNVYSGTPRKGTLLYNLTTNSKPVIVNNGNNIRHFTYIDDVVEGIIKSIQIDKKLVNIRNPIQNTVREYVEEARKYLDLSGLSYTNSMREFDKLNQYVDENIYTIEMDYKPIKEGLRLSLYKGVNSEKTTEK